MQEQTRDTAIRAGDAETCLNASGAQKAHAQRHYAWALVSFSGPAVAAALVVAMMFNAPLHSDDVEMDLVTMADMLRAADLEQDVSAL